MIDSEPGAGMLAYQIARRVCAIQVFMHVLPESGLTEAWAVWIT